MKFLFQNLNYSELLKKLWNFLKNIIKTYGNQLPGKLSVFSFRDEIKKTLCIIRELDDLIILIMMHLNNLKENTIVKSIILPQSLNKAISSTLLFE